MTLVTAARTNMVQCQLQPNAIHDARVLAAYRLSPREVFMPPQGISVAYVDTYHTTPFGVTLDPMTEGKILQALNIQKTDRVLVVGGGGAPTAAVAALLAQSVTLATANADAARFAEASFLRAGLTNMNVTDGNAPHPAFDVIVFTGGLPELPTALPAANRIGGVFADEIRIFSEIGTARPRTISIGTAHVPPLNDPILRAAPSEAFVF